MASMGVGQVNARGPGEGGGNSVTRRGGGRECHRLGCKGIGGCNKNRRREGHARKNIRPEHHQKKIRGEGKVGLSQGGDGGGEGGPSYQPAKVERPLEKGEAGRGQGGQGEKRKTKRAKER